MPLTYQANGNLPAGIHVITIDQLKIDLGFTKKRRDLITGLLQAIKDLKSCGCTKLFLDGSFASNCDHPNDYDACYDPTGMNWEKIFKEHPVFLDFSNARLNQKLKYGGEFFSATALASPPRELYIEFFQKDKNDNSPKGIIQINL
ncbi:MAG: hypothetical protein IPN39_13455 [Chitinophagaceae bacterium]|nr:hypothetical protein [Chitinophagaceae bacterium]MBP9097561.1 hypothetical protein [Ferruginibacter sp.]